MFPNIKMTIGILLIMTIGWFYVESIKSQRDLHEQSAQIAAQDAQSLKLELIANRVALVARETQRAALVKEQEAMQHELEELYEADNEAGNWADNPLPDSIANRLRR